MKGVTYFDCFAMVGRRQPHDEFEVWGVDDLLDEMAHCGIHAALVTHEIARRYDPAFGNAELMEAIAGRDRLYPCWVLIPHESGEMDDPGTTVKEMQEANVRAAKFCPGHHKFHLARDGGRMAGALADAGIPLFVDGVGVIESILPEIEELCARFSNLPVVLLGASWDQQRKVLGVMRRCPNLHIEFSSFQASYALETLAAEFGPERLLFGTEALAKSPGAAKAFIDYSELSDEHRKMIAGGNLARLLKVENLPPDYSPREEDSILTCVKEGRPLDDVLVIDSHAHWLHDEAQGAGTIVMRHGNPEGCKRRYDRMGIDAVCTSAWLAIWADWQRGNESTASMMRRYPHYVIGYAVLDPKEHGFEQAITYWHGVAGMKGLKPYKPKYGIAYDSPLYAPWFEYANEHRLFALLHGATLAEVKVVAARYPEVSFLLAHSAGSYAVARERVALAREFPNVYLEITLTPVPHRIIDLLVQEVGPDKVVFGTDAPMRDPIPQFGWVAYARISEEDKRKVLGLNMQKILGRCR